MKKGAPGLLVNCPGLLGSCLASGTCPQPLSISLKKMPSGIEDDHMSRCLSVSAWHDLGIIYWSQCGTKPCAGSKDVKVSEVVGKTLSSGWGVRMILH